MIDAQNTIIVPGLVGYRHFGKRSFAHQPELADARRLQQATHLSFAKAYRPQDQYVAHYLTAVGCIDAALPA